MPIGEIRGMFLAAGGGGGRRGRGNHVRVASAGGGHLLGDGSGRTFAEERPSKTEGTLKENCLWKGNLAEIAKELAAKKGEICGNVRGGKSMRFLGGKTQERSSKKKGAKIPKTGRGSHYQTD